MRNLAYISKYGTWNKTQLNIILISFLLQRGFFNFKRLLFVCFTQTSQHIPFPWKPLQFTPISKVPVSPVLCFTWSLIIWKTLGEGSSL